MNEENGVIFIIDFLMLTMGAKNLRFLASICENRQDYFLYHSLSGIEISISDFWDKEVFGTIFFVICCISFMIFIVLVNYATDYIYSIWFLVGYCFYIFKVHGG
ncbi:MAG: hypothetical protein Q8L15_13805 [Methylobacter sp.]|nr:hypothetical protein [Methylobacter sp.]